MNRLSGPFTSPPFNPFIISPIGLIPKKDSGDFRLIHDLSTPKGNSVNDFVDPTEATVKYETFDDFVRLLLQLPKGALMAKADIKSAFRILPVSPSDYWKLGIFWDNNYYFDKRLPMGASSSCAIFETISTSIQWILQQFGVLRVTHILDDFMFIGPPEAPDCASSLQLFLSLLQSLNIPVNPTKTVYPHTMITVHGIQVDSVTHLASLPPDKLNSIRTELQILLKKRSVRLRKLQSVIGLLNFACRAIRPGRAFLRRLINLTIGVKSTHHFIQINKEAKLDILTWQTFITHFNGSTTSGQI